MTNTMPNCIRHEFFRKTLHLCNIAHSKSFAYETEVRHMDERTELQTSVTVEIQGVPKIAVF